MADGKQVVVDKKNKYDRQLRFVYFFTVCTYYSTLMCLFFALLTIYFVLLISR